MSAPERILLSMYPQLDGFDGAGMTAEQIHFCLGSESAGVAYFTLKVLRGE